MGIVEHIIFIEPPWSFLLKDAHHITVDISIGVVPADHNNEGGAIYASIRDSDRSPQQEVTEKGLLQLEEAMEYQNEPIEIVTHAELLEHCGAFLIPDSWVPSENARRRTTKVRRRTKRKNLLSRCGRVAKGTHHG